MSHLSTSSTSISSPSSSRRYWKLTCDRGRQVWQTRDVSPSHTLINTNHASLPPQLQLQLRADDLQLDEQGSWVDIDQIKFDKRNKNASDMVYRQQCASKPNSFDLNTALHTLNARYRVTFTQQACSSNVTGGTTTDSSEHDWNHIHTSNIRAPEHLAASGSSEKNNGDVAHAEQDDQSSPLGLRSSVSLIRGWHFEERLLAPDGHLPGDYGGPMFLIPGYVFTMYISGVEIEASRRSLLLRYLLNHQNEDGGWGTHIESSSTAFGTCLNYIAARLLGLATDDKSAIQARQVIAKLGGATSVPAWGKFWLSTMRLYEWSGCHSLMPELWLLPESVPFHPSRWWCHCRMVYLPMAYIYAVRLQAPLTTLVQQLRTEIYTQPYDTINFAQHRDDVASTDEYVPASLLLRAVNSVTCAYEKYAIPLIPFARRWAVKFMLSYIRAEDSQTRNIDIGPVNKFINMLAIYHADGAESASFAAHLQRVDDYLWLSEDGMKVQGYNGSQLWDTAFAAQAAAEAIMVHPHHINLSTNLTNNSNGKFSLSCSSTTNLVSTNQDISSRTLPSPSSSLQPSPSSAASFCESCSLPVSVESGVRSMLHRMYGYLDQCQVREDVVERNETFRHISAGGWPFSTVDHGWPITDCTAEGIKAAILINQRVFNNSTRRVAPISCQRLHSAVMLLLSFQNSDGSYSTYEKQRAGGWLELLNPASIFGGIMVDYGYVECTSAAIQALLLYRQHYLHVQQHQQPPAHKFDRDTNASTTHPHETTEPHEPSSACSSLSSPNATSRPPSPSSTGINSLSSSSLLMGVDSCNDNSEGCCSSRLSNSLSSRITASVLKSIEWICDQQREDGSFYGSWAVCFTYGGWFALSACMAVKSQNLPLSPSQHERLDSVIDNACTFLCSIQRTDGGWGESYECCVEKKYVPTSSAQVVNTAWAVLGLMAVDFVKYQRQIEGGVSLLCRLQQPDGDWPQQNITGVFNNNCMITYINYRNIFPLWALARYRNCLQALTTLHNAAPSSLSHKLD